MSLINQMLKDIDQRQAQGSPLTALPGELGRAPEGKPKTRLSVIALAVVAGLLGAAALSVDSLKARFGQVASVTATPPPTAASAPAASTTSSSPEPASASAPVVSPAPVAIEQVPQPTGVQAAVDVLKEADPVAVKSALSQVAKMAQASISAKVESPAPAAAEPHAAPAPKVVSSQMAKPSASPKVEAKPASEDRPTVTVSSTGAAATVSSSTPQSPPLPPSPAAPAAVAKPAAPVVGPSVPSAPPKGEVTRALSAQQRAANGYADALALINKGQTEVAVQALQANLSWDDAHHPSRLLLARLWTDTGRIDEARALLTQTLAKASGMGGAGAAYAMALVHTHLKQGQLNDALAVLEQHAALAADNAEYHALWAALLQRKGAHDESVSHYLQALRKQPDVAHWLVGLGLSLQAKQMNEAAIQSFERALSLGLPPKLAEVAQERLQALGK